MSSGVTGTGLDFLAIETDSTVYVYDITDTPDEVENALRRALGNNFDKTTILLVPRTGATPTPTDYSKSCLLVPKKAGNIDLATQFLSVTRFTNGGLFADDAGQSVSVKIDAIPQLSFVGIHRSDNPYTVPVPTDNQTIGTGSFFNQQLWVNFNYNYTDDPTKYPTQSFVDSLVEINLKINPKSNLLFQTGISIMDVAASGGGGVDKYVDLTDVDVVPVANQMTHYDAVTSKFKQVPEMAVDAVTRRVNINSLNKIVLNAGIDAVELVAGTVLDMEGTDVTIDSIGGNVVTTATGPTADAIVQAERLCLLTGNGGAALTAGTNNANITATTGDVDVNAPAGRLDVDASVVEIDSTGVTTINSGGALVETAAGALSLTSTGGSISATAIGSTATLTSSTNEAKVKGNSVKIENNGLRFVEIDAANALNSNADGFNLNSIGGTNNFSVNSQGGASMVTTTNTTIQANSGGITLRALGFNAPNRIFINPDGPLDASTFQTINLQAGQSFTAGGIQFGATGTNVSYLQTNGAGAQVESRSSNNQGLFVCRTASTSTPSFSVSPIGNGLTYDIYTDASYTAPTATSLINKTQLEARLPDGVQGAATPQDPFGQALVWNGTQWKPGSAIQGATDEVATLIANGTGDVVLTASGTGNITIDTADSATTVDINSGGIVVPVGGATEPTAKANNNLYVQIAGVAGTDLAILTKDFLNKLYIARSYAEFDSHGNVNLTPMNVINQFEPFANPNPVYAKSEDAANEWSVATVPASTFTFTRAGATNVLFQYSFTVTVVGDNAGINNDKISFALYIDSGGGFVQVPTSVFSATVVGNTDASIVSATGLARIDSGYILQPRLTNTTAVRDMRIEDFKLSITECPTGVA